MNSYWRVFYTRPRNEKKLELTLRRKGINVFLPKREEWRQWKDRKKKVVVPLFSNYIFANVDEYERLSVLQTTGIVYCLKMDGDLVALSDELIEQLRITQNGPERLSTLSYPRPPRGAIVEIKDGPMKGLKGEVNDYRGKLNLLIDVIPLKIAVKVNVPSDWVEVVERG
jgi:transcription antitermination factor NusG